MKDTIYRQDAIDALGDIYPLDYNAQAYKARLEKLPSAKPTTLYGYRIEQLALIAIIMEKECVTPEIAIEHFMNIDKMVQMVREEEKELLDRALRWSEGKEV